MKSNRFLFCALALPLALFAACGSDDDTSSDNGGRGGTASGGRTGTAGNAGRGGGTAGEPSNGGAIGVAGSGGTSDAAGAGGDTAEAGAGGTAGAVETLNDAQILKVLSTANQGEVSVAQVAKPLLQNSAVVTFAQMMINEHGAANGQTLALVSTKHLAPEPSALSESLEQDTAAVISELSTTPAAAVDKVYIDSQVEMHQQVLGLIDARLLPDATDADVKALLGTIRTAVATHLSSAQTISADLP